MSKFVLVDALSQFHMRYVVEVPDDHNDRDVPCDAKTWAEDSVTMEEVKEFSQHFLGETIVTSRELTQEEVLALCDEDNHYCKDWTDEKKMEVFVTPIGYKGIDDGT
jgi:hypothetical protein